LSAAASAAESGWIPDLSGFGVATLPLGVGAEVAVLVGWAAVGAGEAGAVAVWTVPVWGVPDWGAGAGEDDAEDEAVGEGGCSGAATADEVSIKVPATPTTIAEHAAVIIGSRRMRGALSGCKLRLWGVDFFIYNSGTGLRRVTVRTWIHRQDQGGAAAVASRTSMLPNR
jgi:hypothetical protein